MRLKDFLAHEVTIRFRAGAILMWLLLSPAVVLPLLWLWTLPWDSPNAPSWVQAVGSVSAIAVAVWLPWHERNRRQAEEFKREIGLGRRLYYAAFEISGHVDSLFNEFGALRYRPDESVTIFTGLYERFIHSFDDDLDPARVKLTHELRQNLPLLIANLRVFASKQQEGSSELSAAQVYYREAVRLSWQQLVEAEQSLPSNQRTPRAH
ncbi:hypothetical protein FXN65_23940 [Metapseudomonas lalkuanensis]|uniref:Uncharacterized protein n=1 Tax=Metapseudomonas lalkuanensis TaxID=2604832 RepID=A0A5J6QUH3_9GAMM|nr:hypothetical protein [Pseudomonas lalkuanensis]QEY64961.1 hypothetical protein FXN65_23940 [Pseudomonas lalkuanensis]